MNSEILLYGLEGGESERYMEILLASNCKNQADIEKVKAVAISHGFHSFRVAKFIPGEIPNFAGAVS